MLVDVEEGAAARAGIITLTIRNNRDSSVTFPAPQQGCSTAAVVAATAAKIPMPETFPKAAKLNKSKEI